MLQEEGLAFGMGLCKVRNISSRTGIVETGVSKNCFFAVNGLHGLSEECTEDGPCVVIFSFGIPSADLNSELQKEFHVVNAG